MYNIILFTVLCDKNKRRLAEPHKAWRKGPTVQNKGEKIEKKSKGKGQNKSHHMGKKGQVGGQAVKLLLSLHPEHRALT